MGALPAACAALCAVRLGHCIEGQAKRGAARAEVLEAWKKVENGVVALEAVGLGIDGEAVAEAAAACGAAAALLAELFPALLAALRAGGEAAMAAAPFLQAFAGKLKGTLKRAGALPEVPPRPTALGGRAEAALGGAGVPPQRGGSPHRRLTCVPRRNVWSR